MGASVWLFAKNLIITLFCVLSFMGGSTSFQLPTTLTKRCWNTALPVPQPIPRSSVLRVFQTKDEKNADSKTATSSEKITEKYGPEAGIFQSLKSNDGESAKSLLAKYGVAYLATSIPLALLSFLTCYALVDNGIDAGDTGEKAGTFAIAYAAHKAASPIRFPPTVILTPMVAKIIGKEPNNDP